MTDEYITTMKKGNVGFIPFSTKVYWLKMS